jgi:hypothetical protein
MFCRTGICGATLLGGALIGDNELICGNCVTSRGMVAWKFESDNGAVLLSFVISGESVLNPGPGAGDGTNELRGLEVALRAGVEGPILP